MSGERIAEVLAIIEELRVLTNQQHRELQGCITEIFKAERILFEALYGKESEDNMNPYSLLELCDAVKVRLTEVKGE